MNHNGTLQTIVLFIGFGAYCCPSWGYGASLDRHDISVGSADSGIESGPECLTWINRTNAGPGLRIGGAMDYDSVRNVSVLFGGNDGNLLGDTWEWDGSAWTLRSMTGPSPRSSHAMAFDSSRGVTVLFGGIVGPSQHAGDTWEWDGQAWQLRAMTGPGARYGHRMAFDSTRNVVVLFGGVQNGPNETWEWDGTSWTLRSTSGPTARYQCGLVYDSARQRTVLFGGVANGGVGWFGDTWEWDGSTWTQEASGGPTPRGDHAMAYDEVRESTILFGGVNWDLGQPYLLDTWEWNGSTWTPITVQSSPPARAYHAMVFDSTRGLVVTVGGGDEFGPGAGTWELDACQAVCAQWRQGAVGGALPPPRGHHAMAYHPTNGVVLFGGAGSDEVYLDDTWAFDGQVWSELVVSGPSARVQHAMTYAPECGGAILFGGFDDTGDLNDMWRWDGSSWAQIPTDPDPDQWPGARRAHGMAYDEERNSIVLFGGVHDPCCPWPYLDDTWEWDCEASIWSQVPLSGPIARDAHAMAYHPDNGVVVFAGEAGQLCDPIFQGTWSYQGGSWTLLSWAGPSPRAWVSMAYDPDLGGLLSFGGGTGCVGAALDDTWLWTGTTWSQVDVANSLELPLRRSRHATAYDLSHRQTVVFGGVATDNATRLNDTWVVTSCAQPPRVAPSPHDQPKNRYVSIAPASGGTPVAYRIDKLDSGVLGGPAGSAWVGLPDTDGIAPVSPTPVTRVWTEPVVHVGDCMIVPVATFEIRTTSDDGVSYTDPLVVSTIDQPEPKSWGDTVGSFDGAAWGAPNGIVNTNDFLAALQKFQNLPTAPHVTVVDVQSVSSTDPCLNRITNIADVFILIQAFQGNAYPFTTNPAACPSCP